ncbi:hypothetical protein N7513_009777 [Penicillium frequentans]|nr:hypothetical protein N7513_009777 [Penicillium glabrum]
MTGQLVWFVTGCSSGLGEALVRAILAKGDKVIATARASKGISGVNRLSALQEAGAAVLELDVNSSEHKLAEIAAQAWQIYGHVDVVVNNAGYLDVGITEQYDTQHLTNILRTNVFGPLSLSRAFLPLMRARKTGTLLFEGAASLYTAIPGASSYAGSKGLLEGIVQKMASEIEPFGIRTSLLIFGHFRTGIFSPENLKYSMPNQLPDYMELEGLIGDICNGSHGTQAGDPERACELVVEAVRGEGRCAGMKLPLKLPIGPDAFQVIREDCLARLKVCDEWEGITTETNLVE